MIQEWYVDVSSVPNEMEDWFLANGAEVVDSPRGIVYDKSGTPITQVDMYFGKRKIHRYAGWAGARIFFDETNVTSSSLFLMQWGKLVTKHNLDRYHEKNVY